MQIKLREIQHFLYCPHRWGLIEIDNAWAENYFVVKGNLLHERVHSPEKAYAIRQKKVLTGVQVYLDRPKYSLFGVVDCLEATADAGGVLLEDKKRYKLCIVEYKPSMPKDKPWHEEDVMQVFAQKLCVDAIFGCDCEAVLYYAKEKRRQKLPFAEEYQKYAESLHETLLKIADLKERGVIPPVLKGQNCSGCSMRDLCMPARRKNNPVEQTIRAALAEDEI